MQHSLPAPEIVKSQLREGGPLRDKDLVILFYAYGGERRSSAPLRRDSHLEKKRQLRTTPRQHVHISGSCDRDLGRIKAEYFNLAPEFTWLCQSNYLTPLAEKNAIMVTVEHTFRRGRYKWL